MLQKEPLMGPCLKDKYPELIGLSISLSTTIDMVNSIVYYHHSLDPKDYSAYIDCRLTYSRLVEFTKTDQQFGANKSIVCPETGPLVVPPLQYQEYSIFPNLISLSPAVLKSDDPALSPSCRARKMTH